MLWVPPTYQYALRFLGSRPADWPLLLDVSQALQGRYVSKSELDPNLLPLQCFQPANVAILFGFSLLRIYWVMNVFHLLNLFQVRPSPAFSILTIMSSLVQAIQTHAIAFQQRCLYPLPLIHCLKVHIWSYHLSAWNLLSAFMINLQILIAVLHPASSGPCLSPQSLFLLSPSCSCVQIQQPFTFLPALGPPLSYSCLMCSLPALS